MDNANPVEPLQNPGETPQPSVLDRVFNRQETPTDQSAPEVNASEDNVLKTEIFKCINPSCASFGKDLSDGTCQSCGL